MFRRLTLFLALFCSAQVLLATDRTYELLTAPHVRDKIRIQLSADRKGIEYQKDEEARFADLAEGITFALHDQADIVFRDFNPFLYSVSSSQKMEPDPNFGSIVKFLDAARATGENLTGLFAAILELPGGGASDCDDLASDPGPNCKSLARFKCLLEKAAKLSNDDEIDQDDFKAWRDDSTSAVGVRKAREAIDAKIDKLSDNTKSLAATLAEIEKLRTSISFEACPGQCTGECRKACGETPSRECEESCTRSCSGFDLEIALLYSDVQKTGEVSLKSKNELKTALKDLSDKLKSNYESPAAWREDHPSDYIIAKPKGDPENVNLFTVTIKDRKFVADNGTFKIEEKEATSKTFRLRKYSALVPEIGGGVLYSNLKYPRYGTEQKDGKTLVKKIKDENADLSAAVVLNMYTRLGFDSFVYPGFQIGVANAKDFPGFLFGFQARFTRPRALSISAGALVTWYKDLDQLKPGQEISGTAALEEDLELKRAPVSAYFGIQYNF